MNKIIKIGIILFLIVFVGGFFVYAQFYYHAEKTATDYLNGTDDVNVSKISKGLFLDGYGNNTTIIFYPGAKVEYTSYLPLFTNLASKGIDCYLVEMPFNLAFFGTNSADDIIKNSSYQHYFMAGHSLGGAMAGSYVNSTSNNISGLIYLSSHLPKEIHVHNFTEIIINGGNHAQFGYYGVQSGDNPANITPESQQNQTADAIIRFINENT